MLHLRTRLQVHIRSTDANQLGSHGRLPRRTSWLAPNTKHHQPSVRFSSPCLPRAPYAFAY